jgi:Tetratricopeptide repeat
MASTIASSTKCYSTLAIQHREIGTLAGDISYELATLPSTNESFSVGSAVSADSFVVYLVGDSKDDDSDEEFCDPYLASNRRIRLLGTTKRPIHAVGTPVVPMEEDSSTEETTEISQSPLQGLPHLVEVPIKNFQTGCQDDDWRAPTQTHQLSPAQRKCVHERYFWNNIVSERIKIHGAIHLRVSEGLMLLGNAHMNCKEYFEALKVFKSAVRIFRKLYGDSHLTVARSLDKVGLVCCRLQDDHHVKLARLALDEAFAIRYDTLGPIHVDTVDSLNNIAGVHLHQQEYQLARKAYHEVYLVRQIIFGPSHPAVAITAHALGSVHLHMAQIDDAAIYYRRAMEIYKKLNLTTENPTMQRLLRDVAALERVRTK